MGNVPSQLTIMLWQDCSQIVNRCKVTPDTCTRSLPQYKVLIFDKNQLAMSLHKRRCFISTYYVYV